MQRDWARVVLVVGTVIGDVDMGSGKEVVRLRLRKLNQERR